MFETHDSTQYEASTTRPPDYPETLPFLPNRPCCVLTTAEEAGGTAAVWFDMDAAARETTELLEGPLGSSWAEFLNSRAESPENTDDMKQRLRDMFVHLRESGGDLTTNGADKPDPALDALVDSLVAQCEEAGWDVFTRAAAPARSCVLKRQDRMRMILCGPGGGVVMLLEVEAAALPGGM